MTSGSPQSAVYCSPTLPELPLPIYIGVGTTGGIVKMSYRWIKDETSYPQPGCHSYISAIGDSELRQICMGSSIGFYPVYGQWKEQSAVGVTYSLRLFRAIQQEEKHITRITFSTFSFVADVMSS